MIAGSNPAGTSILFGVVAESVDASDLKSGEGNLVWVQVPSAPPTYWPVKAFILVCAAGLKKMKKT